MVAAETAEFDLSPERSADLAHSSSGLGHLPLKEEITGSNPVCATNDKIAPYSEAKC
jgi:hypothetical protein